MLFAFFASDIEIFYPNSFFRDYLGLSLILDTWLI